MHELASFESYFLAVSRTRRFFEMHLTTLATHQLRIKVTHDRRVKFIDVSPGFSFFIHYVDLPVLERLSRPHAR